MANQHKQNFSNNKRSFSSNRFTKINQRIQAPELRVIGSDGHQIGVLSREEALSKAEEEGLDLVEVAANANPPVAKIIDFQKYKYQENKKEQAAKKHAHEVELKEVWLSPRIAAHDLEVRIKKADDFLEDGDKVKFTVKFRGREMAHPEVGHKVLNQVLTYFGERIKIEREVRFEGRNLSVIIGLIKKGININEIQT